MQHTVEDIQVPDALAGEQRIGMHKVFTFLHVSGHTSNLKPFLRHTLGCFSLATAWQILIISS